MWKGARTVQRRRRARGERDEWEKEDVIQRNGVPLSLQYVQSMEERVIYEGFIHPMCAMCYGCDGYSEARLFGTGGLQASAPPMPRQDTKNCAASMFVTSKITPIAISKFLVIMSLSRQPLDYYYGFQTFHTLTFFVPKRFVPQASLTLTTLTRLTLTLTLTH